MKGTKRRARRAERIRSNNSEKQIVIGLRTGGEFAGFAVVLTTLMPYWDDDSIPFSPWVDAWPAIFPTPEAAGPTIAEARRQFGTGISNIRTRPVSEWQDA